MTWSNLPLEGHLQVKGADAQNTKWRPRAWQLHGDILTTVDQDEHGGQPFEFQVSEITKIKMSASSPQALSFVVSGVKVKLKAESPEEAQAWFESLRDAKADIENMARSGNGSAQSPPGKAVEDADIVKQARRTSKSPGPDRLDRLDGVQLQGRFRALVAAGCEEAGLPHLLRELEQEHPAGLTPADFKAVVRKYLHVSKHDFRSSEVDGLFKSLEHGAEGVVYVQDLITLVSEGCRSARVTPRRPSRSRSVTPTRSAPKASETALSKVVGRIKTLTRGGHEDAVDTFHRQGDKDQDGVWNFNELVAVVRFKLKFSSQEISDDLLNGIFEAMAVDGLVSSSGLLNCIFQTGDDAIVYPVDEERFQRLHELHDLARTREEKLRRMEAAKIEDEDHRIAESKRRAQEQGAKTYKRDSGSPFEATERLYRSHFETIEKKHAKYRELQDEERQKLEEERIRNLPTRRALTQVTGSAAAAGKRLYDDATRRVQMRHLMEQVQELADEQEKNNPLRVVPETRRHEQLFNDAAARKERLEYMRQAADEEGRKKLEAESVGAGKRSHNARRTEELYLEHTTRQQRIAAAVAEKHIREQEQIEAAICSRRASTCSEASTRDHSQVFDRLSSGISSRRSSLQDSRRSSLEDQNSQKQLQQLQVTQRSSLTSTGSEHRPPKVVTKVDNAILNILATICTRCGYPKPQLTDVSCKRLAPSLKAIMKIYEQATKMCEATDGYPGLCARSSQRLFQEHLVADFDGWTRNTEPDPIKQVEDKLEDLLDSARMAQSTLKKLLAGKRTWGSSEQLEHPGSVPVALFALDPGVKPEASCRAKAAARHAPSDGTGGYRHLLDLSRLLLVFSSCDLLIAGLEQIQRNFEVVDVRNYFNSPGRLGARFVEVLVVIHVGEGRDRRPHVCELRLEEAYFHRARQQAEPKLQEFLAMCADMFDRPGMDLAALKNMVHTIMMKPPRPHGLSVFTKHMRKRYGSTVCGWRRAFGGGKHLGFQKFREVCQHLSCGEHATAFWQALDPGLGGSISLFDFDLEAAMLLIKFRSRLLVLGDGDDLSDRNSLFARLTMLAPPKKPGQLEAHEFRAVVTKALGFSTEEADKLFSYLDYYGGNQHNPPALVTAQDFAWLSRLPQQFNIDAIMMCKASEMANNFAWGRMAAKHGERQGLQMWSCLGKASPEAPGSPFAAPASGAAGAAETAAASAPSASKPVGVAKQKGEESGADSNNSPSSPSSPPRLRGMFGGGFATKIAESHAIPALSLTPRTVGRKPRPEVDASSTEDAADDEAASGGERAAESALRLEQLQDSSDSEDSEEEPQAAHAAESDSDSDFNETW
eukprot:TRINITY_DN47424_c0_g1_i1.p1 TRINITY_DN47424_c0_g1~~TRINITY_DN47424_c0_g1_i1.p1  ORF type:complete len:1332 (+),score=315.17 TRINITY_DN47424_c0_g1_i1:77-4072(+)